jgi:CO/xanthine dehydrogenase Mo-binding subunit
VDQHVLKEKAVIDHDNRENYLNPVAYDLEGSGFAAAGSWLLNLAQAAAGPVLELGCGTGLFTIPLAQQGVGMTGLEVVPPMLAHARAKAVITAVAQQANWQPRLKPRNTGRGQGIAFAQYKNIQCYCAIVVEVSVDQASGQIRLERAIIAADAGLVVNPDGLSNQLEGGFVQAASWTLKEQMRFDASGITSRDWESYSILRFSEAPLIETVLLNRPDLPFLGSGEASQNPTPAAIANAVFNAVGVRLREIPFTPERVKAAMPVT